MWKDCLVLLNNAITKSSKEASEHVHKLEQLSEHEKDIWNYLQQSSQMWLKLLVT